MIEVSGLSRHYGDTLAVDNVGFTIRPGEIVGLLGHNGAGKTTVMKMLTGYLEPSSGRIAIDGMPMTPSSHHLRASLGYLPEASPVYPEMNVHSYLQFAARMKGLSRHDSDQAVVRVIRQTGLEARAGQRIQTLSRGFRQRVGVAQALLGQPRVLVLDEPTNGLDPAQIEMMRALIRGHRAQATVLLSTHIMQEVTATCDRVLIMRHGRIAVDASLASLQAGNRLLLSTSADQSAVAAALVGQPVSMAGHDKRGRILLQPPADDTLSEAWVSRVARALLEAGIPIAGLSPEQRDLEQLFHEITQPDKPEGDFEHAA